MPGEFAISVNGAIEAVVRPLEHITRITGSAFDPGSDDFDHEVTVKSTKGVLEPADSPQEAV
jgi:hypothetical protein